VRHFWLDEAEPEIEPLEYHNIRYYQGNGLEISSLYPYYLSQAIYEGQIESGQTEIINLTRSGWIGSQRLGALLWSGDIRGDFPTLRKHIKAGLNIGLAGIPWWTTDIGGFWADPREDGYTEVLIRWFQFAAFSPVMRIHGVNQPGEKFEIEGQIASTGAPNEVWSFGGDRKSYTIEDQYMFGPDILVAPVLEAGANSRTIYLPAGSRWKDALTGETFEGGQTIDHAVSIENIPLFTRNGFDFEVN